ncbi:SDR family NAD(P)-dependent oxidoreductase [Jongsikchunia kroppenstedtii]|uniref:SDR family NAD(P)-dependent oxidoreductase n=1 Tax=Jongsikchunia kroppenstedtii TaxID=1121721 RepID=UPI0003797608|nr:SDR family NAD(P)-dependent oxidoreductase [Jongsikchunia kroppenstedtii]
MSDDLGDLFARRFADKTAVVTGAASGIGAAIARRLIAEGATVVGLDIAEDALVAMAGEFGDAFLAAPADVTDEDAVSSAIAAGVERYSGIDLAFNVAGASRYGPITELAADDWDFTVDLVQKAVFLCVKHEARQLVAQGRGGAIVNVASLNAHIPMVGGSPYSTGKAGVEMFSKNAALELAPAGVRVNAVLPGLVDTPLVAPVMGFEPAKNMFLERIPMGRAAAPDEIAAPCLYLASDDASYVTGTSLMVDGGWEISNYANLTSLGAS